MTEETKNDIKNFIINYGPYFSSELDICDYVQHPIERACTACPAEIICKTKMKYNGGIVDQYIYNEFKETNPEYFL